MEHLAGIRLSVPVLMTVLAVCSELARRWVLVS
jgi:hypothetical protein